MNLSPVIIAIPMYFTLMAIELVYESITNRHSYRLNDAVTNISTGALSQLTGTFMKIFKIGIYTIIYEQFAFYHIPATWGSFFVLFILYDLAYYWEHRLAHEVSLFWGGHVVHHQSEEYNLSVALRQTSTGFIWGFPFFLPMAFMGFDPMQLVVVGGLNLLYQFWIHTEHINKMGWFEYAFNTPSHHRVHHGRDPKYIDKNYAGVFIIWDRMFGTFKEEEERPNYGITKPLKSWNPVYANFAHYIDLWGHLKQARSVKDGLQILFRPPGWLPEYLGGPMSPETPPADYEKYNRSTSRWMNLYVLGQFIIGLLFIAIYLFKNADFDGTTKIVFALWIIWTTTMFGFLFESSNRWVPMLEVIRLLTIPVGMFYLLNLPIGLPFWTLPFASALTALSLGAFIYILRRQPQMPTVLKQEYAD